jgi:peptide deformylase
VVRPILRYGADVLERPAQPVERIDGETQALLDDMVATMHAAPGVGLAAPQIGVPLRLFVVDLSVGRRASAIIEVINPVIVERSGMQLEEEGCLSVPGFNATVCRPSRVTLRGFDREGTERTWEGTGLLARAFQHEMDHLDGRLFVERLRWIRRRVISAQIRRLRRKGRW